MKVRMQLFPPGARKASVQLISLDRFISIARKLSGEYPIDILRRLVALESGAVLSYCKDGATGVFWLEEKQRTPKTLSSQ